MYIFITDWLFDLPKTWRLEANGGQGSCLMELLARGSHFQVPLKLTAALIPNVSSSGLLSLGVSPTSDAV